MGSKNKNIAHRSRIIDSFLAKFKKVVNSAALTDKAVEAPMASLVTPAGSAVMVPPTALRGALPAAIASSLLNGQPRYASDARRSSDAVSIVSARSDASMGSTRSDAVSIGSAHSVLSKESEACSVDSAIGSAASVPSGASAPIDMCTPPHQDNECPSNRLNPCVVEKREASDFIFGKIIGEGSFSTVYLSKDIHTKREYAIKVCMKTHIVRERKVEQIRREREILTLLSSKQCETAPFFVRIYSSFQDRMRLFFVLTYAKHGELFSHINKVGSFDAACTRFYAGEILHALEHMHGLGIVHRDLKPENILLDQDMHVQITDFGSAKILSNAEDADESAARRNSFVGTAQYISPELLSDRGDCSHASDLWAFGAIVYQMVAGLPPFRSSSEYLIFRKIKNLEYAFPDGFHPEARDLVERLLVLDPRQRLGATDETKYTSIRRHPFFEGMVLEDLYKQTPPAIYPYLPGSSAQEELRSHYRVPDHLEPGLDDRQITRLLGLELQGCSPPASQSPEPTERRQRSLLGLASLTPAEEQRRLAEQRVADPRWHALCSGNLILKRGLVHKRKGLFARRRMLMLTLGPHLYYADPDTMTLKGEIPWSPELRVEPKNFKIFFVHTPNRTYYLQDPEGYALDWCKAIEEMRVYKYGSGS